MVCTSRGEGKEERERERAVENGNAEMKCKNWGKCERDIDLFIHLLWFGRENGGFMRVKWVLN